MKLTKWTPFQWWLEPTRHSYWDVSPLFDQFDSFFNTGSYTPAIDVYEEDGKIRVKAEVPGLTEKEIKVEVKDSCLTISGEK